MRTWMWIRTRTRNKKGVTANAVREGGKQPKTIRCKSYLLNAKNGISHAEYGLCRCVMMIKWLTEPLKKPA